jgi:LmbE family N-acetylglucosaminyl deacetylase
MNILLSPHQDDEILFTCYTLLRERPKVIFITDSYTQWNRGDGITAEQRNKESRNALDFLGIEYEFLGLRDDEITEQTLHAALEDIYGVDKCYSPAFEIGGNPIHNLVSRVADVFFDCTHYMTYSGSSHKTKGSVIITPTSVEKALKRTALTFYPSQSNLRSTACFFNHPEVLEWESYE